MWHVSAMPGYPVRLLRNAQDLLRIAPQAQIVAQSTTTNCVFNIATLPSFWRAPCQTAANQNVATDPSHEFAEALHCKSLDDATFTASLRSGAAVPILLSPPLNCAHLHFRQPSEAKPIISRIGILGRFIMSWSSLPGWTPWEAIMTAIGTRALQKLCQRWAAEAYSVSEEQRAKRHSIQR